MYKCGFCKRTCLTGIFKYKNKRIPGVLSPYLFFWVCYYSWSALPPRIIYSLTDFEHRPCLNSFLKIWKKLYLKSYLFLIEGKGGTLKPCIDYGTWTASQLKSDTLCPSSHTYSITCKKPRSSPNLNLGHIGMKTSGRLCSTLRHYKYLMMPFGLCLSADCPRQKVVPVLPFLKYLKRHHIIRLLDGSIQVKPLGLDFSFLALILSSHTSNVLALPKLIHSPAPSIPKTGKPPLN